MRLAGRWYGFSAVPLALILSVVHSQRIVTFAHLTVFAAVASVWVIVGLIVLPTVTWRRSGIAAFLALGATFFSLWIWAAVRTFGGDRVLLTWSELPEPVVLPDWVAWVPTGAALLAFGLAAFLVLAIPQDMIKPWLWWMSAALVLSGVVGLVRISFDEGKGGRLATGLGGAATLPLAYVMVVAACIGLVWSGYRVRSSALLAVLAGVQLLLTGSRAGFMMLGLLVAAVVFRAAKKGRMNRRSWIAASALVTAVVAAVVFIPGMSRLLVLGDARRQANATDAIGIVMNSPNSLITGVGNHVVWPWYAVDAEMAPPSWGEHYSSIRVPLPDVMLLQSPHSLYLQVFVELGIVGLVLLAGFLIALCWELWQARTSPAAFAIFIAAATGIIAFTFDHYLFKNFGVSWVWWCFLLAATRLRRETSAVSEVVANTGSSTLS